MAKFYVYNTSNNSVLNLYDDEGNVTWEPFNGSPEQQWEFSPSTEQLGQWNLKNVGYGTRNYLHSSIVANPRDGTYIVGRDNPFPWVFKSLTVVPLPNSLFKLEYKNLVMTVISTDGVVLNPDLGQLTSGTQVWQLKPVN